MESSLTILPVRLGQRRNHLIPIKAQPRELRIDAYGSGIPSLYGKFGIPAPQCLHLILRIHNQAGIPIIEGETKVDLGQYNFVFHKLNVLGIEAYAHLSEVEQQKIIERIWTRRAYANLTILPISMETGQNND
jgi:hypothetical protein